MHFNDFHGVFHYVSTFRSHFAIRNMQRRTLGQYFTKQCKFQVGEEGDLQDQPASLQSLMEGSSECSADC